MTTALDDIAFKAHTHPKHRFQNLYGLLNTDRLYQSWGQLNKQAAPGIDGITINHYQQRLSEKYQSPKSRAETEMLSSG
jgi:RNA-directed DNA polymerase